jgi:hypothetical protein
MASPADDRRALTRITWYAVLNLVEALVGLVAAVGVFSSFAAGGLGFYPGASIGSSGPTAQQLQAMAQGFQYLTELIPIVLIVGAVSLVLLWTGFRGLLKAGARSLSLPSKLTLVAVIACVLLLPGTLLVWTSIVPLMALAAQQTVPHAGAASLAGPLILGVVLVLIGAVLGLTGAIGGVLLGLWRVGGRYDQTILKVAAIFVIIPFLSIVSPILVIIGVSSAKGKVGQARPAAQ